MMLPSTRAGIPSCCRLSTANFAAISWSGKAIVFTMDWGRGTIRKRKKSGNARILKISRPSRSSTSPISVKMKAPRIVISSVPSRPIARDSSPIESGIRPSQEPRIGASSRSQRLS
jgi:hypothetical protein